MANFNKVILLGNLTREPEMRFSQDGTAIATFGLAVNRGEEVCFIDVVTFGRQAETVGEYLAKGSLVLVEGRLQWRSWETGDGQRRTKHEVIANTVQFMPRGSNGANEATRQPTHATDSDAFDDAYPRDLHDIPF